MAEVTYGRTESGQLVYDFAFVNLTDKWLAQKHRMSLAQVRKLRKLPAIVSLRRKARLDRQKRK